MNSFVENNHLIAFIVPVTAGVLALILCAWLFMALRRLRRDQKIVMGAGDERDIIAHNRALQQRVDGLALEIRDLAGQLEREGRRLDDCITYRSVVRYDAYHDLSGMQSTSVCLIDTHFSGIIISSIQSRDHARIYVKEVRNGESREKLSPEETQVFKEAMGLKKIETGPRADAGGAGD
ncbi:MAG: DUF4446 family protein [Thermoleophilia bacterium]